MINILVIEDNPDELNYCCAAIKSMKNDCRIFCAANSEEALKLISSNSIDLFFIDIRLPGASGYELAGKIREVPAHTLTPIVFITGEKSNQLLIHKRYHHYEYIEKPYSMNKFTSLMQPVFDTLETQNVSTRNEKLVLIPGSRGEFLAALSSFCFAEAWGRKTTLYTAKNKYEDIPLKLTEFVERTNDEFFIRCHRSYAVNVRNIQSIKKISRRSWGICFTVSPDLRCPMSATYSDQIKHHLNKISNPKENI